MKCAYVMKRLTRYLERMCSSEETSGIARHIETCPVCARELRGLRSVRGILHCCRSGKPPAVAVAEVQTAILESTTHAHMVPGLKRNASFPAGRARQYIAVAATLLLVAGGLIWQSIRPADVPAVPQTLSNDDMFFILQEHALIEDQGVFTGGTLGSVMVNYKE